MAQKQFSLQKFIGLCWAWDIGDCDNMKKVVKLVMTFKTNASLERRLIG